MKIEMNQNAVVAFKHLIDKAFSTGAGVKVRVNFLLQMQKRLDNSEELNPIISGIEIEIK